MMGGSDFGPTNLLGLLDDPVIVATCHHLLLQATIHNIQSLLQPASEQENLPTSK